ncbi:E3 ubiquitin-protein ligase MARCHF2-like [Planococcus citri]|uniref:E3 ubiquitin-protein ligase MARCHF2-like n=1 Tax=Planococcus citri TaxID=170843 RepID=UPI0031F917D0
MEEVSKNVYEGISPRHGGSRCRICLLNDEESKKKLVTNICNCKGASGNVHIECLETWIMSSNRDHCEVCLEKIYIERLPKFGILRSIPVFLYSSRISQLFVIMIIAGIAVYVTAMWYIDRLNFKHDSNANKFIAFIANIAIFGSVFIISYSPLLCLYVWDLWKEWRRTQYRLRIRPRIQPV